MRVFLLCLLFLVCSFAFAKNNTFNICGQEVFFDFYKNKNIQLNKSCSPKSSLFIDLKEEEKETLEFSDDSNKTYIPPEIIIE